MYRLARLKVKDEKKKLFAELIVGEAGSRIARIELSVAQAMMNALFAVSYTHLTLPTNREV